MAAASPPTLCGEGGRTRRLGSRGSAVRVPDRRDDAGRASAAMPDRPERRGDAEAARDADLAGRSRAACRARAPCRIGMAPGARSSEAGRGCAFRQIPGAPALLLAVGIARLGVPALSLAMLLAAREASGGYGMAGAVGAAYALAVAAFQLGWGRAADRRGAAGIVRRTALAHGAALALFAALAQAGVTAALIPAAALAGACFPPVATVSRAAWREVDGEDERRALFALDGVTTEVTLIVGPLLATVLVAVAGAPTAVAVVAAMVAAAALSAAGSPLLPSGREDPPGVRPHASVEFHNRWLCKSTLARRERSAEQRGELRSVRWRAVPRVVGWRRRAGRRDGLRGAGGRDELRGGLGRRDGLRGAGTRGALRGPGFPPALVTLLDRNRRDGRRDRRGHRRERGVRRGRRLAVRAPADADGRRGRGGCARVGRPRAPDEPPQATRRRAHPLRGGDARDRDRAERDHVGVARRRRRADGAVRRAPGASLRRARAAGTGRGELRVAELGELGRLRRGDAADRRGRGRDGRHRRFHRVRRGGRHGGRDPGGQDRPWHARAPA